MDAMQFLRGIENPMQAYTLPHLGLVPDYQQRLQAIYPGQSIAQLEQNAYDANRAEFDRLLALGRPDVLQTWITSRLQGTMYEDLEELAFALGRSVDELQYFLSVDPLELLRQAEAQQEAARLAEIAANAERERLRQIEEQRAADARVRQWELEAQQLVAETAARDAARTAQLIAQAEKQLRDELRAQWPAGDIDAQVTIYNQLLTQPPRSHAEVESILRDVLGEGAELQTLLRFTRNAQQGISLAETAAQIARDEAEAPIRAFQAATQADLQKTLQFIAESGSVPVEEMIATGAYTQAQIDLAAQVQARQLAEQQKATRLDLARQEAEQRAKVDAELAAQAQAQAQAIAEEQAAIEAYIAQEQAAGRAALEAQPIAKGTDMERYVFADFTLPQGWYQFTGAQKADWFNQNNVSPAQLKNAGVPDEDIAALRQEGYIVQDVVSDTSQSAFDAQMKALQDNVIEIWSARAYGRSYALPVWSIQYPLIPADVVENWLASFGLPTIAELEAELAASQAAATGVDVSRGIDATSVVTAPAAPSDAVTVAPVVTAPVVTAPVVTAPSDTVFPDTSSLVAFPGDADSYAQPVVTAPLIALPDDWDTYSDTRKIAWFNANQIKPSQLIAAGVPTSDLAFMRANGYIVQEQAPAAGGAAILLALASAYFLGA